ncbi:MAG TPA: hypothetical protein VGZ52_11470 [Acidimicrobiales bacterium]|jgi:hypothetical protein|nr:hypothetical protein [Acidimicrobiales bacterium]
MKPSEIDQHDTDLAVDLAEHLVLEAPIVRHDVIEAARERLERGSQPTALDLAGTVVAHFA